MEGKTTVYVRHLDAPHQTESLTKFQPLNPLKALWCLTLSRLHGSKALVPSTFSHIFKTV